MLKLGLARIRADVLDHASCSTSESTAGDGQEQMLGHSGANYTSVLGTA